MLLCVHKFEHLNSERVKCWVKWICCLLSVYVFNPSLSDCNADILRLMLMRPTTSSPNHPPPSPLTDDCDHGWYCWGISYTIFMFTWTWISCFYHKSYCQNIQIRYSSRPDYVLLNKGGFIHVAVHAFVCVCMLGLWVAAGRNLELPVYLEFIEFIRVGNVIEFCFCQCVVLRPGMFSPLPSPHSPGSRRVYARPTRVILSIKRKGKVSFEFMINGINLSDLSAIERASTPDSWL